MRLFLFACLGLLSAGVYAASGSVLWTQSFYAPKNETLLKLDADDNVYAAYVNSTHLTLRKFSPTGAALWTKSVPYVANAGTKAQLEIGPEGDPYLATVSGAAQLRRFDRLNGSIRWTINPPMPKFHFSIYEKISVYGDRPSGQTFAAQCLTYRLDGSLTQSTGFEAGYRAGMVWDGLIRYNLNGSTATKRALIKARYGPGGFFQLVIDDQPYTTTLWELGALAVNQNAPYSQVVLAGKTENNVVSEIYRYNEGRVGSNLNSSASPQSIPTSIAVGQPDPYTVALASKDKLFVFNPDGSPFRGAFQQTYSTEPSITLDHTGQIHTLWAGNGSGIRLDHFTQLDSSMQSRSPSLAVGSNGDIFVSYIRQNGSPAFVISRVHLDVFTTDQFPTLRNNGSATIDLFYSSYGYDDGTSDEHFSIGTAPTHGTAEIQPGGRLIYTPDPNFSGADTFTYRVSKIGQSVDGTVTARVHPTLVAVTATDSTAGAPTTVTAHLNTNTAFGDVFHTDFAPRTRMVYTGPDGWDVPVDIGQSSGSKLVMVAPPTSSVTVTATMTGNYGATATTTFVVKP